MTISETGKSNGGSFARDLLRVVRHHIGARRALLILAIVAVGGGIALNWSWLVAIGLAPVLLSVLPCLAMCGLGLCMNKFSGTSCKTKGGQSANVSEGALLPLETRHEEIKGKSMERSA